jgi:tRNA nucleotidyltransferase (CCA-adding enzyme)
MSQLRPILELIRAEGGQPFEVGGCVRDRLLGETVKDVDIEVFHLDADTLMRILGQFGRVDSVGVSFGVIKLWAAGEEFDFALPRRESKTGRGYRGFQVEVDHTLTVAEAAARRDFTINAIYRCPLEETLHDPCGGISDLEARVLRATSPRFAEDPLRVLRGMQFASRFGLSLDKQTASLCQSLLPEANSLAQERIWIEWKKWAARGEHPSAGLRFLRETEWVSVYPELLAIIDVPQDPKWHPEGDVWTHTLHVCDVAAAIASRDNLGEEDRLVLMFAALCHDLGKATTTEFLHGRWRARGHCEAGVAPTESFLRAIGCPETIIEQVTPLVIEHLVHAQPDLNARAVRRLAQRLGKATISQLLRLIEADLRGRPPLPGDLPAGLRLIGTLANEENLTQGMPQPLIGGRHIIAAGYQPARWFGEVLKNCFEAQLDGLFSNEAEGIAYLRNVLDQRERNGSEEA